MKQELINIAEAILKDTPELFLVDIKVSGKTGTQKIVVLVDSDSGIGIDDCSRISRKMASVLEERDLIDGKFIFEVSSPGADSPLVMTRQYKKNVGRKLKLLLKDGAEIKGSLMAVTDSSISINSEIKKDKKIVEERIDVPFNTIEKAKVLISF